MVGAAGKHRLVEGVAAAHEREIDHVGAAAAQKEAKQREPRLDRRIPVLDDVAAFRRIGAEGHCDPP